VSHTQRKTGPERSVSQWSHGNARQKGEIGCNGKRGVAAGAAKTNTKRLLSLADPPAVLAGDVLCKYVQGVACTKRGNCASPFCRNGTRLESG